MHLSAQPYQRNPTRFLIWKLQTVVLCAVEILDRDDSVQGLNLQLEAEKLHVNPSASERRHTSKNQLNDL